MIIPEGTNTQNLGKRDIIVRTYDQKLHRIWVNHSLYDPLHYILFFMNGEQGWQIGLRNKQNQKISCQKYYSYRLMIRNSEFNILHHGGRLFQQYCVDMFSKMDALNLKYIKNNQDKLRADLYSGLKDTIHKTDTEISRIGKRIILPSSYPGGPRYMHSRFQDAMAMVREFGKPDLFITFTCNPNWTEIKEQLYEGQNVVDRPDLTARVFHMKLKELLDDLIEKDYFGRVVGHLSVVEFQKRGLPHAHILIILSNSNKLRKPEDYDKFVSAEIPNRTTDPRLYNIVRTHMIHNRCNQGSNYPCLHNGKCSKYFPKNFSKVTTDKSNSYPIYRRRRPSDGGLTFKHKNDIIDNRWVVPYNGGLLLKYEAH